MAMETPLRAEEEKLGATFAEYFGVALPENFGDPEGEYRAARASAALVDTNYHAIFALTGPDRARYLNALVTNHVAALAEAQGAIALLLTPQGRIQAELECYALADSLLVLGHASARERALAHLEKYIIMDDVTLDDATARFGSFSIEGPKAPAIVSEFRALEIGAMAEFAHAPARIGDAECRVIRRSRTGLPGAEFLVPRELLARSWAAALEIVKRHGGGPAGYAAVNTLRLEAGIPWFGADFGENQIPHQAALEATHVSFSKGCYTGQEIVERVRSQGHVQRKRVLLKFSGGGFPKPGTPLAAGDAEVGFVTSAARSPALGAAIGMGYVRREQTAPGTKLRWNGGQAEVIGKTAASS